MQYIVYITQYIVRRLYDLFRPPTFIQVLSSSDESDVRDEEDVAVGPTGVIEHGRQTIQGPLPA